MPHLFERRAMFDIESRIGPALALSRRNKMRDRTTDINIHLQQEARLRKLVDDERSKSTLQIHFIDVGQWVDVPAGAAGIVKPYMHDEYHGCSEAEIRAFWKRVYCRMLKSHPWFITIDDNISNLDAGLLKDTCRASHRIQFQLVMSRFWSQTAPWELADAVQTQQQATRLAAMRLTWNVLQLQESDCLMWH